MKLKTLAAVAALVAAVALGARVAQAFLGGVRDTLAHLTPQEVLPPGSFGEPAVLRVPAAMRAWALAGLRDGRLSLEDAASKLCLEPGALVQTLARLGLE